MLVTHLSARRREGRKAAQPVPSAALSKFKFKLKAQKSYSLVWSNKNSGAHFDLSIWQADLETNPLMKSKKATQV